MKRRNMLMMCIAACVAHITIHASCYVSYGSLSRIYEILERHYDDPDMPMDIIDGVSVLASVDVHNLVSEGEREALEWTRKYVRRLYPQREAFPYVNIGHRREIDMRWNWIFTYLAVKGDRRDIELVDQYDSDGLGALLRARVVGTNVFEYDASSLSELGAINKSWFFPSVANTGPQAVYVREILYRYWEEHGRDVSKMPQELLTMTVSFGEDGKPVSSADLSRYGLTMPVIVPQEAYISEIRRLYQEKSNGASKMPQELTTMTFSLDKDGSLVPSADLAKYGLTMPVINLRPGREYFNYWNEGTIWDEPMKIIVAFPDLAEPAEITPYSVLPSHWHSSFRIP